ncbi:hypothetical protein [Mesorhizobium xinjiangense]|uniref:hypothetical protein n=1 Tax=Mesorhizobium xinjiangense TaxID=2678685 RepID=UPI0012ECD787|nr:hypothetical protein [Mesorhizobium xinjiangense]
MGFEKVAGRFNTWVEFFRNLREIGAPWGITPSSIVAATILYGGMVWAMIREMVPWYVYLPIALLVFGSVFHLYAGIAKARSVQGIRKISLDAVADACERFEERYWNFLEAHRAELKEIADAEARRWGTDDSGSINGWEHARQLETNLMRKMKARLGSDVAALMAMFSTLEIGGDSDFRSVHWSDGQARYYGAIGKLLRQGMLEEARKLNRHDIFF